MGVTKELARRSVLLAGLLILFSGSLLAAEISANRQSDLLHLLRHDCGSCHGMTLQGGLGPSLLPSALAGKPVSALEHTILKGVPGTPMPPWGKLLTADEARWLVNQLLTGVSYASNK